MTVKKQIIKKIENINNAQQLKDLNLLINAFSENYEKDTFSSDELNALREGYTQYLSGKTISHEEAKQEFNKWAVGK